MLGEADRTQSLAEELNLTCIYSIYIFPRRRIITQEFLVWVDVHL